MRQNWIFDFDGTLVNTDGFFQESINFALKPFGIEVGAEFIEEVRHRHPTAIFDHLLSKDQAKEALQRLTEKGKELAERITIFDGMREVLETLASQGSRISIWTGRDRKSTLHILEKTKSTIYFDKIVSGTCVINNKPHTDGLVEISKHFSKPFEEMIVVGDHHHDIGPANDLGCFSVHAQWKEIPHLLPENIQAKKSFTCIQEFHTWVKNHKK